MYLYQRHYNTIINYLQLYTLPLLFSSHDRQRSAPTMRNKKTWSVNKIKTVVKIPRNKVVFEKFAHEEDTRESVLLYNYIHHSIIILKTLEIS